MSAALESALERGAVFPKDVLLRMPLVRRVLKLEAMEDTNEPHELPILRDSSMSMGPCLKGGSERCDSAALGIWLLNVN